MKIDMDRWFYPSGKPRKFVDPYRRSEDCEFCNTFFDEDGYLRDEAYAQLVKFIHTNKVDIDPLSFVVEMVHAQDFARNTKSNYSAVYMWR